MLMDNIEVCGEHRGDLAKDAKSERVIRVGLSHHDRIRAIDQIRNLNELVASIFDSTRDDT